MDIEHLSKSQIILLTLLVSFVTSIATGIVTVSLMEQAPPVVAQTVNRVIEHTVEKVAPATSGKTQAAATVVTQEKTVVVSSDELLSKGVEKVTPSIVRLYETGSETPALLGIGVVFDDGGTILSDSTALGERSDALIARADGTRVRAFVVRRDKATGAALLQAATSTEGKPIVWKPAGFSQEQPVLGISVVAIAGKTVARIATGVVTAIIPGDSQNEIDTNVDKDSILMGSPIINAQGEIIGVSTGVSRASTSQGFVPASAFFAK